MSASEQGQKNTTNPPTDQEDERTMIISEAHALNRPSAPPNTDTDPNTTPPAPPPEQPVAADGLQPGTVINNNYRIQSALKSGGMGEVYRGIEIGTEDPVAIKAIRPDLIRDAQAGEMFKREARTLRLLTDDAIVRYYNYVHDQTLDRYFLVMEFISGVPLSDYVRQHGGIGPDAGKILLSRLAKGLAKAHGKGVVHRDLSPDNVMLPDGLVGEARLIDFGIARAQTLSEGSMTGRFAGKFKYVSPEQLGHFGGTIGPAADIYGLALLIAAALLGKPLEMGSSITEAVEARRSIPDLSALPADLRPLLTYMLEPDPANRPSTMQDVLHCLDHPASLPVQYLPHGTRAHQTVPGLQVATPGLTVPPQTGVTNLQTPVIAAPRPYLQPIAPATSSVTQVKRSSGGLIWGIGLALLCLIGGTGFWFMQQTDLMPLGGGDPLSQNGQQEETLAANELPARARDTREGFLAAYVTEECSLARRLSSGPNAGRIETYSDSGAEFAGLTAAYESQFGFRPSQLPRAITPDQCAAVEFAHALQGRWPDAVQTHLSSDTSPSGAVLRAETVIPQGQSVWVALISPQGRMYNLTDRLTSGSGSYRSLEFGLTLAPDAAAAPQLVLTLASAAPLARTATTQDGAEAADVLPRVLEEIRQGGQQASAALSYVLLTPDADGQSPQTVEDQKEYSGQ